MREHPFRDPEDEPKSREEMPAGSVHLDVKLLRALISRVERRWKWNLILLHIMRSAGQVNRVMNTGNFPNSTRQVAVGRLGGHAGFMNRMPGQAVALCQASLGRAAGRENRANQKQKNV